MSDEPSMNYLFYLGIIIPTIITIVLFAVFIYCWFLQKARKEVLTKKYDPHGKMRQLGLSMDPPAPPDYCRLPEPLTDGEDNEAYDVSRSPSAEQDALRQPGDRRVLYQSYHDSGISAGRSPSSEFEPRAGLAYRSCPDSGISGFGNLTAPSSASLAAIQQQAVCHGCGQHQQLQLGHEIQLHHQADFSYQPGRFPPNTAQLSDQHTDFQPRFQPSYPQQAALHQQMLSSSVHSAHGVCYGDNLTHPQSPQHYNPLPVHPGTLPLHHPLAQTEAQQPSFRTEPPKLYQAEFSYHENNFHPVNQPCHDRVYDERDMHLSEQIVPASVHIQQSPSHHGPNMRQSYNISSTSTSSHPLPSSQNISSSSSQPGVSHSYRDSGVISDTNGQCTLADRPDSQASQSSTTDSEDSGFRSSHCAGPGNQALNKQVNPLLRPMRRTKNPKGRPSNKGRQGERDTGPSLTLNPQTLAHETDVLSHQPLMELALRGSDQWSSQPTSPSASQPGPVFSSQHSSPTRESAETSMDSSGKQLERTDISTHLSWKFVQDMSAPMSNCAGSGVVLQTCHPGLTTGQLGQGDQAPLELYGYSVV